jgi:uncharacterized protein (DUF3820 family)
MALIKSFGKHNKVNITSQTLDNKILIEAVNQTMPFGKYTGRKLFYLPEPYLVWFNNKGFPEGKLGQQLALMHEVKVNGLESMLAPLLRDN